MDYAQWSGASHADDSKRVFTLLACLPLAAHAWIGIWAVLTDYVTERLMGPNWQCPACQLGTVLALSLVLWLSYDPLARELIAETRASSETDAHDFL
jgi:succinate dehydrogenase / fumarate reductase membrane anchor subunit